MHGLRTFIWTLFYVRQGSCFAASDESALKLTPRRPNAHGKSPDNVDELKIISPQRPVDQQSSVVMCSLPKVIHRSGPRWCVSKQGSLQLFLVSSIIIVMDVAARMFLHTAECLVSGGASCASVYGALRGLYMAGGPVVVYLVLRS